MTAAPLTLAAVVGEIARPVRPAVVAVVRILPLTPGERADVLAAARGWTVATSDGQAHRVLVVGGVPACSDHGATCPAREAIAALTETCHPTENR